MHSHGYEKNLCLGGDLPDCHSINKIIPFSLSIKNLLILDIFDINKLSIFLNLSFLFSFPLPSFLTHIGPVRRLSVPPASIGRFARAPCPARPPPAPYGRSPGQGARASCPSGGFAGAHAARTPLFARLGARPHPFGRYAPSVAPAHPACVGSRRSLR